MKIRNEPEHIAGTVKSFLNWRDHHKRIPPKNADPRYGLLHGLRHHLVSFERENHSKYCIILNLLNVSHTTDHQQQRNSPQQQQQQRQHQQQNTLIKYLLYKLTQLCLVIVLLLPFLITYNTLIQEANGQYVRYPIPLYMTNLNSIQNLSLYKKVHAQDMNSEANHEFQIEHKLYNTKSIEHMSRRKSNEKQQLRMRSRNSLYTYNHRSHGNSLIILSQFADHLNSGFGHPRNPSLKPNHNPNRNHKTILSTWFVNDTTIRTKRYVDINSVSTKTREINNREQEANSQILGITFDEKHIDDYDSIYKQMMNNKEKITKLVMNGLGLKKLPDMKKANISQKEYSSKYLEYLERLRRSDVRKNSDEQSLEILSIVTNKIKDITRKRWRHKRKARSAEKRVNLMIKKTHGRNLGESSDKTNILLHFPLRLNDAQFKYDQINEANVRLMMLYNPSLAASSKTEPISRSRGSRRKLTSGKNGEKNCKKNDYYPIPVNGNKNQKSNIHKSKVHILNLRVYQLLRANKRQQLDSRKIEFESSEYRGEGSEETRSQWLEFDVTTAVRSWLNKSRENLGIEIQCDKCRRIGARILSEVTSTSLSHHFVVESNTGAVAAVEEDAEEESEIHNKFHLTPVLNIIGHIGRTHTEEAVHPHTLMSSNQSDGHLYHHRLSHGHSTNPIQKSANSCVKAHQRCCRHQLDVAFKDIKGFEFIIQPKTFDAGYCKGRCPPRHNPAHHHALLQSLIWQQDHNRVPRPCCAPSKLAEIEILHVDEEHTDKLKISTWSNMQVLECACS